jgi:hypothetical protein
MKPLFESRTSDTESVKNRVVFPHFALSTNVAGRTGKNQSGTDTETYWNRNKLD